jgi:hypothetical protein
VTRPWPWAIWYPLRRAGSFEQLSAQEQRTILMEHGGIGHAYGRAGYGTDIRLACYGLDQNDNDFRRRADRAGALSALVDRAADAQDQADFAAPGAAGAVLCRQGDLAE